MGLNKENIGRLNQTGLPDPIRISILSDIAALPALHVDDTATFFEMARARYSGNKQVEMFLIKKQGLFAFIDGPFMYRTGNHKFNHWKDLDDALFEKGFPIGREHEFKEYNETIDNRGNVFAKIEEVIRVIDGTDYYKAITLGLNDFTEYVRYHDGLFHAHNRVKDMASSPVHPRINAQYGEVPVAYFRLALKHGFSHRWDYEDANGVGIDNFESFKIFVEKAKELGFKTITDYKEALKMEITNPERFEIAKACNFEGENELKAFEAFYNSTIEQLLNRQRLGWPLYGVEHGGSIEHIVSKLESFREAIKGGFQNEQEFNAAKRKGFTDGSTYNAFLQSGCITKEEYERVTVKLPPFIAKTRKIMDAALVDAGKHYQDKNAEAYVTSAFNAVDKGLDLVLVTIQQTIPTKDDDVELELKLDKLVSLISITPAPKTEEVIFYRRLRNRIVHENFKIIDANQLDHAKFFFDEMMQVINKILDRTSKEA